MFEPQHARQKFDTILRSRGLQEDDLNLGDGCEAFFNFYRHPGAERACLRAT
jgi:hypothetical protein